MKKVLLAFVAASLLKILTCSVILGQTTDVKIDKLSCKAINFCTIPEKDSIGISISSYGYSVSPSAVLLSIQWGDGKDTVANASFSEYSNTSNKYTYYRGLSHSYIPGSYTMQVIAEGEDGHKDTTTKTFYVASTCKSISGKIYIDKNTNCQYDAGDTISSSYLYARLSSDRIYDTYLDPNDSGNYIINVPINETYTLTIVDYPYTLTTNMPGFAICPSNGVYSVSSLPASGIDFAMKKTLKVALKDTTALKRADCLANQTYNPVFSANALGYNYVAGDSIKYKVYFGDGQDSSFAFSGGQLSEGLYASFEFSTSHKYASVGTYTLRLYGETTDGQKDSVILTDAVTVKDTCGLVTGKIYVDLNKNCVIDGIDPPTEQVTVWLKDSLNNQVAWALCYGGQYSIVAPDKTKAYSLLLNSPGYSSMGCYRYCPTNIDTVRNYPETNRDFAIDKGIDLIIVEVDYPNPCSLNQSLAFAVGNMGYYGDSLTVNLSFGDGIDSTFKVVGLNEATWIRYTLNHRYSLPGTYSLQMIITAPDSRADTLINRDAVVISNNCADIGGKVYTDGNSDCLFNSGDSPLIFKLVQLLDNGLVINAASTDSDGNYSFKVDQTGSHNYKVRLAGLSYIKSPVCPLSGEYAVTTFPSTTNDFGISCNGYDLSGSVAGWHFKPGYSGDIYISAKNRRCESVNGTVKLVKSSLLNVLNSEPPVSSISGDTLIWDIPGFDASKYFYAHVTVETSTAAVLGDSIYCTLLLEPITNDSVPGDNKQEYVFPIKNSWDPNLKMAVANGKEGETIAPSTKEITYTVFFQNTGNDAAYNIFVMDTLDKNIDAASVEILSSSHAMKVDILPPGNILKFIFNNIMLADSFSNEPASHGFVSYKVHLKDSLPIGTNIKNTAYIYFDFNPAVVTNTTKSTLTLTTGIAKIAANGTIQTFPNPVNTELSVVFPQDAQGCELRVHDLLGNIVFKRTVNSTSTKINTSDLPNGLYLLTLSNGAGTYKTKFVVIH